MRKKNERLDMPLSRRALLASAALPWLAQAGPSFAQEARWPNKPIRLVIPFAAGGTADMVARLLAAAVGERLGQAMVVESRPGANGIIGADSVAKSPADGYSLLLHSSSYAINAGLYKKLPYDAERAFVPVAPVVAPGAFVIAVNPSLPVRNVRELVELARTRNDPITYGSAGVGNGLHLAGEMFGQQAGVRLLHVPYKGGAAIVNDLVAGQIDLMFNSPLSVAPFVKDGKLRVIAQTGLKRASSLPDLPTVAESGIPGLLAYEATSWYGLYAPAGTPAAIVARLNAEVVRAMNQPEVASKLAVLGTGPLPAMTADQFATFTHAEVERYARVIRNANLSLEAG